MSEPEQILVQGDQARVSGGDGGEFQVDLGSLVTTVAKHTVRGLERTRLPQDLCWKIDAGPLSICILELPPQLRRLLWGEETPGVPALGPNVPYQPRRLAVPYTVLKVPFLGGRLLPRVELFYRNQPLGDLSDELYWPNLPNVSPNAYGVTCWFCTQYVGREHIPPGINHGLKVLIDHLWGGGWNRSSEFNEGASTFSKAQEEKVDPRVTDVNRWEQESIHDPRFILTVPWKPVGMTVRQLIKRELQAHSVVRNRWTTAEMVSLLLGTKNGRPAKADEEE